MMLKKKAMAKKLGSVSLAAVLALTMGVGATAVSGESPVAQAESNATQQSIEKHYKNIVKYGNDNSQDGKEETAYAISDANGNTSEVIVEEWLKNGKKAGLIHDTSSLSDVENTSGHQKVKKDGTSLTWSADGSDIHYEGKADTSELPVTVSVSYYLNGQKKTPEQIKGKAGHVQIRFNYNVNRKETVSYGGSSYSMTHPYTMASGVVLPNAHFTNVEVNSGKNVSDGENNIVLGLAFPGLAEDLNLGSKIDIPSNVVIEADTDKFTLDGTYTVAMDGLLGDIDFDGATGDVKSLANKLESSMKELSSASTKLVKGSKLLDENTEKLAKGTDTLDNGATKLKKGSNKLSDGAKQVSDGAKKLDNSVQKINLPSVTLTEAQQQKISQTAAGSEKVTGAANQLSAGIGQGVSKKLQGTLTNDQVVAGAQQQAWATLSGSADGQKVIGVLTAGLMAQGMDQQTAAATAQAMAKGVVNNTVSGTMSGAASQITAESITSGISDSVTGAVQQVAGASAIAGGQGVADEVNKQLGGYSVKFDELKAGTKQLADGSKQVKDGSKELGTGVNDLKDGTKTLSDGAGKLADGANTLAKGMQKFDKEGIQNLVSSLSSKDLKSIANRLGAVAQASKESIFIGGKASSVEGKSKIIFKTAEIK